MKKAIFGLVLISSVAALALAGATTASPVATTQFEENGGIPGDRIEVEGLDRRTRAILEQLVACESGGDPYAVNPEDLDGTASYGCLQFKPSTLLFFGRKYGVIPEGIEDEEIMNLIFDCELQVAVASRMIEDRGAQRSFWKTQFPGCSEKNGFWENYYTMDEERVESAPEVPEAAPSSVPAGDAEGVPAVESPQGVPEETPAE